MIVLMFGLVFVVINIVLLKWAERYLRNEVPYNLYINGRKICYPSELEEKRKIIYGNHSKF